MGHEMKKNIANYFPNAQRRSVPMISGITRNSQWGRGEGVGGGEMTGV